MSRPARFMTLRDERGEVAATSNSAIHVLVATDQWDYREAVTRAIEEADGFEASVAESETQALERLDRDHPEVLLLDLHVNGADAPSVIERARQVAPETVCVVLTASTNPTDMAAVLKAGAAAYLVKQELRDHREYLRHALWLVCHGGFMVGGASAVGLVQDVVSRPIPPKHRYELTPREREVLENIVKKMSNNQIAEALLISPQAVKHHVSRILSKLHVATRDEAAEVAQRQGLVHRRNRRRPPPRAPSS